MIIAMLELVPQIQKRQAILEVFRLSSALMLIENALDCGVFEEGLTLHELFIWSNGGQSKICMLKFSRVCI